MASQRRAVDGGLDTLKTLPQLVEIGRVGAEVLERADGLERLVDTIVVGLAGEVQLATAVLETPERRLGETGVGGDTVALHGEHAVLELIAALASVTSSRFEEVPWDVE